MDPELVDLVRRSLAAETRAEFERRVDRQAATLRDAIAAGRFDNEAFTVGFELEAYAVDDRGRLARVPDAVFEAAACGGELGLHNVEVNTAPDVFDADGIASQAASLRERVGSVRDALDAEDLDLVLDGMWTIPPAEGTGPFLSAVGVEDGITVAENMRASPRYCAIDNDVLGHSGGAVELDLPGVTRSFPTILVESVTTSVQPHLQVPAVDAFPDHYDAAIRTLGPVLALATNSPFLPADLYEEDGERGAGATAETGPDPHDLVERTHHELRVPVFEQSIDGVSGVDSAGDSVGDGDDSVGEGDDDGSDDAERKVRVPRDIEDTADVVDRLVADRTCAPFLKEWVVDADADETYADHIWELDHKRGTYWRWLRAVVGGEAVAGASQRSVRIEYRPLPTQPTVADVVALQCLVSGLVRGLVAADHPIGSLPWSAARRCFYDVVVDGLDADLAWVDADGRRTDDPAVVFGEVFEYARRGLREQGLPESAVDDYLAPIERRWEERTTPSHWKKRAVRARLDDGEGLRDAIEGMQREYVRRSGAGEPFVEW